MTDVMVMRPEEAGLVLESLVNSIHGVKSIRDPEEGDLRSLTTKKQIANGMNRSQPKLGYKIKPLNYLIEIVLGHVVHSHSIFYKILYIIFENPATHQDTKRLY